MVLFGTVAREINTRMISRSKRAQFKRNWERDVTGLKRRSLPFRSLPRRCGGLYEPTYIAPHVVRATPSPKITVHPSGGGTAGTQPSSLFLGVLITPYRLFFMTSRAQHIYALAPTSHPVCINPRTAGIAIVFFNVANRVASCLPKEPETNVSSRVCTILSV